MTKTNTTRISVILDRSGSMGGSMRDEVIGGFNAFVDEQRKQPGKTRWTLMQFDRHGGAAQSPSENNDLEYVYRDIKGKEVPHLSRATYVPRGSTPLLDAVGTEFTRLLADNPSQPTVVLIITDGQENSSTEYRQDRVKELVAEGEGHGWQVIFMASGLDAAREYAFVGGATGQTITTDSGTYLMANTVMSDTVSTYRATNRVTNTAEDTTKKPTKSGKTS